MNNFYLKSAAGLQNFLGCTAPSDQSIALTGFEPNTEYNITWFPTHTNTTVCPDDTAQTTDGAGTLVLVLATEPFGSTIPYYLDTLHSDYAFIITIAPFVKSMAYISDTARTNGEWDFTLYPNPAQGSVFLRFEDDSPKTVTLLDVTGRALIHHYGVTAIVHHLALGYLAKGAYWVRVGFGVNSKVKKLIIN
ncbi:MAG: T9SS type A sorting domain-containing protein [Flavobacteriales bacterium]|nr:T9SS type A sorting domain-containing protein [Flavobacteriales bacterium]